MALAVINLLVRQFGAEECFSSSKLDVTCRQEGQHLLYKVKRDIFIGRLINSVSAVWHIVLVPLFLALICTPLVFSFILLLPFIFPSGHRFILWSHRSLSPSSSHFLPSAFYVAHTEWIVTDFIPTPHPAPSPKFSYPVSPSLPLHSGSAVAGQSWRWLAGWANGCNTGHGSCLSSPLVSCVAASGAACLPTDDAWAPGVDGSYQPWTCRHSSPSYR